MGGETYAVVGAEHGVGHRATALGVGSALEGREYNVALADLDVVHTDLAETLGVDTASAQEVLARKASVNDAVADGPGGTTVVPAFPPEETTVELNYRTPRLARLVEPLKAAHEFVLLDAPPGTHPLAREVMDSADGTILVTTPDSEAVEATEKLLDGASHLDTDVLGVVLTGVDETTTPAELVTTLGQPLLATVPESATLDTASVTEDPHSAFVAATDKLATQVLTHADNGTLDVSQATLTLEMARMEPTSISPPGAPTHSLDTATDTDEESAVDTDEEPAADTDEEAMEEPAREAIEPLSSAAEDGETTTVGGFVFPGSETTDDAETETDEPVGADEPVDTDVLPDEGERESGEETTADSTGGTGAGENQAGPVEHQAGPVDSQEGSEETARPRSLDEIFPREDDEDSESIADRFAGVGTAITSTVAEGLRELSSPSTDESVNPIDELQDDE